MTRTWKLGSINSQEFKLSNNIKLTQLGVEFEVGRTLQLRPNQVVRENSRTLWVSNIKINFRGEETVTINSSSPTARTIFFDCHYTVWESQAEYIPWKEFYPGVYKYEFALKLPPVNFPPSVEGPKGFSIRYVWQPVIEGTGGPLDEGPEVVTPFVPIWFAPPDEEYQFAEFLDRPSINVEAILPKHKHERSLVSTKRQCDVGRKTPGEFEFSLLIPKKFHYVPPTYKGNHLRVYYTIRCVIQWETRKLLPNIEFYEVIIPITMVSFPHIPQDKDKIEIDTSYPSHNESHLIPFFFDPCKDFPPNYPETDNNNNYPETNNNYSEINNNYSEINNNYPGKNNYPEINNNYPEINNNYPKANNNNYFSITSSDYSFSEEEVYSRKTDQT
ncbi:175_t:CDS:2 [Diversispora eburnea]|uniref:175_t:CDS:1 n=1 Tax=Diversispora eburnea TaxID=1213867 RepID=A0A9N9G618_9GLOM|nr:175_t:CDS:2 [Diversispora eburnea]